MCRRICAGNKTAKLKKFGGERMRLLLRSAVALSVILATGCSTVTISRKGTGRVSSDPTWEASKPFFLGGLIGQSDIDVNQICGKRGVRQMQTQDTFLDSFLTIITIAIYAPRTAKVWCGKEGA
jgi:hypothetical protein